jgi:hypothetical protein
MALWALMLLALPSLPRAQSKDVTPGSQAERSTDPDRAGLEAEIRKELGGTAARPSAAGTTSGAAEVNGPASLQQGGQGSTGGNALARLLLMPDISAIASFTGVYDGYDVENRSPARGELLGRKGQPTFVFQEVEMGMQAVVDSYFRADAFVSFTPDGVDVEEAYATTLALPGNLQLRAGKFFSPFGRMNQQHPHVWEFVDPPLARGRLLAKEVLSGPGLVASWLAPTPWFTQLELAAQDTAPFDGLSPELTGLARLLQYFPLTEAASVGVGLSGARRREGAAGASRDLGAVDVYLRDRPASSRSYLAVQGELYLRKFHDAPVAGGAPGELESGKPEHGFWAQAFWRQDAFLGYGARYEEAPAAGSSAPGTERRVAGVLDWYPSEFSRIALETSYDRLPGGRDGFEGLLHFEFAIGAHGAHPF